MIFVERSKELSRRDDKKMNLKYQIMEALEINTLQVFRCSVLAAVWGSEGSIYLDVGDGKTLYVAGGFCKDDETTFPTSEMTIVESELIFRIDRSGELIRPSGKIWNRLSRKCVVLCTPFHTFIENRVSHIVLPETQTSAVAE